MKKTDDTPFIPEPTGVEKQTFVKATGQKFAFKATNIVKENGWIEFDRVNTKTGEIVGRLQFPMSSIESIETR